MTHTISIMSANYVARELGYHMTEGWSQGDAATNAFFQPLETFPERFGALLDEVGALGVGAVDLWTGHLNPAWATPEHVAAAKRELARTGLSVASLAGGFGDTPAAFGASCRLAAELGAPVLGGSSSLLQDERDTLLGLLRDHGLRFGLENHPEKTPAEIRAKLGDRQNEHGERLGVALDTGWFGTHGYDTAQAVVELADVLVHVHLKDVRAVGAHETCRFGEGVVAPEACVRALQRAGYSGGISVEHEPETFDPTADLRASVAALKGWLA